MARTRDRASAAGLLPRMEAYVWKDGKTTSYRYHPIQGKPIALGTDLSAAIRTVLSLNGNAPSDTTGTLLWVWEQYKKSPRWKKYAQTTRDDYEAAWKQLESRLGHMHMTEITTAVVVQYVHIERGDSPRRADIEKSLLSRMFGHGIKLGVCITNSTIGVEPHGSEPRTVAPKQELLAKYLEWLTRQTPQRQIIGMAAEYASLAGNRKAEFLALEWSHIDHTAGEIRLLRAKQRGGKRGQVVETIAISPQMNDLLHRLRKVNMARGTDCLFVFPTRDNNAYTQRGFKTLWHRCIDKALEEKVLTPEDRFTFHDLRAYYVTMHKKQRGHLPDMHANPATTARVYDRSEKVGRESL